MRDARTMKTTIIAAVLAAAAWTIDGAIPYAGVASPAGSGIDAGWASA